MTTALLAAALLLAGPGGNEFFALDTAMVRYLIGNPLQRADVEAVAALGYSGIAPVTGSEPAWRRLREEVLPWMDAKNLKLYAVYTWARVERGGYSIDPGLQANIAALKGRGTIIWLALPSREFQPSDPAADDLAVAAIRQVSDLAAAHGLSVSLYPHVKNLAERVSDVVRLAEKSGRKNVGVTFNLCHWLRTDGASTMQQMLKLAMPRLTLVTINGADRDGKKWIQPLDSGDFDVAAFLRELRVLGYRGPIGLQGWNVAIEYKIEPVENLRRSMAAWKALSGAR